MVWEHEIDDILEKSGWEPDQCPIHPDLRKILDQVMPMMMTMMILLMGQSTIDSPTTRNAIREALTENGIPADKVDQFLYFLMEKTTRPLVLGDDSVGEVQ